MSFADAVFFILLIFLQQMFSDTVGICSQCPHLTTFTCLVSYLATACYRAKDSSKLVTKIMEAFASPVLVWSLSSSDSAGGVEDAPLLARASKVVLYPLHQSSYYC